MFELSVSKQSVSHFSRMLGLVSCPKNSLCYIAVYLLFFNESLLLEVQIWGYIHWIFHLKKMGSDENQFGEVMNEGVGCLALSPPYGKCWSFWSRHKLPKQETNFVEATNTELSSASSYNCLLHQDPQTCWVLKSSHSPNHILLRPAFVLPLELVVGRRNPAFSLALSYTVLLVQRIWLKTFIFCWDVSLLWSAGTEWTPSQ